MKAALIGIGISIVSFGAMMVLAPALGIVALIIIFPLVALIAAGALWLGFDVEPLKAGLGGVGFSLYKVAMGLVFYAVSGS